MQIIPVLDLYKGVAVHAREGKRDQYQPVSSRLCHNSEPAMLLDAYLSVYPFQSIYVADLDAIRNCGDNSAIIHKLSDKFPQLMFWIDSGMHTPPEIKPQNSITVIGSETGITVDELENLPGNHSRCILSLDFKDNDFLGDDNILKNPHVWPETVIIMSLDRVGSSQGPDFKLLHRLINIAPDTRLFAAGGVRNMQDLDHLNDMKIAGVLLASALHNKELSSQKLDYYHRRT